MGITNGMVGRSAPRGQEPDVDSSPSYPLPRSSESQESFITMRALLNSLAIGLGLWAVLLTVAWLIYA